MVGTKVTIVMLRQPRMSVPTEMRSDPFWEYGSFGTTGCHQRNLLHPKNAAALERTRLAFAQGSKQGPRLVMLTPPVRVIAYSDRCEVLWEPCRPFRYEFAPVIVDSNGYSDMPLFLDLIKDVRRNGRGGKFASRFRTRCEPLPDAIAASVVRVFDTRMRAARRKPQMLADTYEQALPCNPPLVDRNRQTTYERLRSKLCA